MIHIGLNDKERRDAKEALVSALTPSVAVAEKPAPMRSRYLYIDDPAYIIAATGTDTCFTLDESGGVNWECE